MVQIFTTGNRDMKNPYYRPLYPYFNPEAEDQWIAVTGLKKLDAKDSLGNPKYDYWYGVNKAGEAKWWTVAAPGARIYSSIVYDDHYVDSDAAHPLGSAGYATFGGTSMAAPHVAGAVAVLMERYPEMTAPQIRQVLLTTANHKNSDGSNFDSWSVGDHEVDPLFGWGVPDLKKGMYGLGQLLGSFDYKLGKGMDVWSNDIVQVALEQRQKEDAKWLADIKYCLNADGTTVDASKIKLDKTILSQGDIPGLEKDTITKDEARGWIKAYYEKRITEIKKRENLQGALVKSGAGKLVLTGNNSYKGDTTVAGGTLLAFAESIGNDKVTVNSGATFGVLSSYDDQFTKKGYLASSEAQAGKLEITVKDGGTLQIDAASNVKVKSLKFDNATSSHIVFGLEGADGKTLGEVYAGTAPVVSGTFTVAEGTGVYGSLTPTMLTGAGSSSVFFDVDTAAVDGNTISVKMKKKADVTVESFADNANQARIATAIVASGNTLTGEVLGASSKESVKEVLTVLDDDFYASARNGLVMNATAVSHAVMDQARGMGEGRTAEIDNGRARIWAAGIGHWGEAEGNKSTMDVDFRSGFIGAEAVVCDATKLGAFFGYGSTDYSVAGNKIDADDMHYGVYGLTDIADATFTYGVAYTDEDRDTVRNINGTRAAHSEKASVLQAFVEGSYNFDLSVAKVSPYVGFTWARVEQDGVTDFYGIHQVTTDDVKDDLQIATLGVRTAVPFSMGNMPVALKADLGYAHFFGDTDAAVNVQMGANGQFAKIEGSELKDQVNLGLGLTAQVAKHATVGVSYSGAWGSDIKTHGIFANARINF